MEFADLLGGHGVSFSQHYSVRAGAAGSGATDMQAGRPRYFLSRRYHIVGCLERSTGDEMGGSGWPAGSRGVRM
jgi:hypothetical protein